MRNQELHCNQQAASTEPPHWGTGDRTVIEDLKLDKCARTYPVGRAVQSMVGGSLRLAGLQVSGNIFWYVSASPQRPIAAVPAALGEPLYGSTRIHQFQPQAALGCRQSSFHRS